MRLAAVVLALAACGGGGSASDAPAGSDSAPPDSGLDLTKPPVVDVSLTTPPQYLSSYNLFTWSAAGGFTFNETGARIVPYDLNTPLFSDDMLKSRAIYVPPGMTATFDPELAFDFPVGSALIKTFSYAPDLRQPTVGVKLVETRLLVRYADGWHPLPYIWNDAQTDAVYTPSGDVRSISFTDDLGTPVTASYLIPEKNECQNCHAREEDDGSIDLVPIGIKARHLDKTYAYADGSANILTRLSSQSMLAGLPELSTITPSYDFTPIQSGGVAAIPAADVDTAARSYLDINCAHCHNPHGVNGITSQLFLNHDNTDPFHLGVCKRPGSAGNGTGGFTFDIVPGDADTSILYFRVHTTQVGAMMPLIGRSLEHVHGSDLVHAWIAAMPAQSCD
ncbi:MAG TPA: SO2930 family diheme c-type cytochrome [Kofleriaceae bacterium]|jgi:uncharacterized repeat protein (TIGR03806 family)